LHIQQLILRSYYHPLCIRKLVHEEYFSFQFLPAFAVEGEFRIGYARKALQSKDIHLQYRRLGTVQFYGFGIFLPYQSVMLVSCPMAFPQPVRFVHRNG
jgi:hypothetical protein